MAAFPQQTRLTAEYDDLKALTAKAWVLAITVAAGAANALACGDEAMFQRIARCEEELDVIDRDFDQKVSEVITRVSPEEVRELLCCMKILLDLERIGDLVSGAGSRVKALGARLESDDSQELIRMASVLEQMLSSSERAFQERDVESAIAALRQDHEIDRLRNVLFFRHLENENGSAGPNSIHVLLISQAMERAGDHAKNIAEEVCHFISGRTVRHLLKSSEMSSEQMFLRRLRRQVAR